MAKLLGDVKDFEDYKQKIVKQRQLKKKTVESVKKYLKTEDIKLLETQIEPTEIQMPFKEDSKRVQTLFKNNSEKYEYLVKNDPNNSWITEFKNTILFCMLNNTFFNVKGWAIAFPDSLDAFILAMMPCCREFETYL